MLFGTAHTHDQNAYQQANVEEAEANVPRNEPEEKFF